MKHQNLKEPKNQSLDKLLKWFETTKRQDEIEVKKNKVDFIYEIKKFKKEDIKNSNQEKPRKISIWMRIKKTLGLG